MGEYKQDAGGQDYRYEYYTTEYGYYYKSSLGMPHDYDHRVADTYQPAPTVGGTIVADEGVSSGAGGGFVGSGGWEGFPRGNLSMQPDARHALSPVSPVLTIEKRLEEEGPCEDCYGFIAELLAKAKPMPKAVPGLMYGPNEGHGADMVLFLTNVFGNRIPVNVGFVDGMIDFPKSMLGLDGIKRPDHLIRPKYGIVTYQDTDALQTLAPLKGIAKIVGMQVHSQTVNIARNEKEVREQIDDMGLLPQDVAACLLYGLVSYGRHVPQALVEKAVDMGVVSINAAFPGGVVLPTKERIFRIQTGGTLLDEEDATLVKEIFSHLTNAKDIFGSTRRKGEIQAIAVDLHAVDHKLVLAFEGKNYDVVRNGEQFTLQVRASITT